MELERMGFDLTLLALVVMGNAILVAVGAGLVAYLKNVINRWKANEIARTKQPTDSAVVYVHEHTDSDGYTPTGKAPVCHAPSLMHKQRRRYRKVMIHPSIQAVA